MKMQRIVLALTILNSAALLYVIAAHHSQPVQANAQVLRGRGLQSMDGSG